MSRPLRAREIQVYRHMVSLGADEDWVLLADVGSPSTVNALIDLGVVFLHDQSGPRRVRLAITRDSRADTERGLDAAEAARRALAAELARYDEIVTAKANRLGLGIEAVQRRPLPRQRQVRVMP